MSLITDLLSKITQNEPKRDVPPLLRDAITQRSLRSKIRNKTMVIVIASVVIVMAGSLAIYSVDYFASSPSTSVSLKVENPHSAQQATTILPVDQKLKEQASFSTQETDKKAVQSIKTEARKLDIQSPIYEEGSLKKRPKKNIPINFSVNITSQREKTSHTATGELSKERENITRQDKDYYLYTAQAFEKEKEFHLALASYKKVLIVDPGNYRVMNNMSSALINLGEYQEAIKYGEQAIHFRKQYVPALINLGIAYNHLGRYLEGEKYLKEALDIEPLSRAAMMNAALLYEKREAYDEARKIYLKLSGTADVQGYIGLARICEKQGKTEEAIHYYRGVMSLENRNSQIWNLANDRLSQLIK
jgi:tetratricopeptide (TPR) repeat protein